MCHPSFPPFLPPFFRSTIWWGFVQAVLKLDTLFEGGAQERGKQHVLHVLLEYI